LFRELAPKLFNAKHGLVLCLSLTAAAGWASFAVSSQSSTEMERQLRRQETSLQDTQTQLLSERTRTQASRSEMAQLRADLAATQSKVNRLSQSRDQARAELAPAKSDRKGRSIQVNEAEDDVSATSSIGAKAMRPPQGKAAPSDPLPPQARNKLAVRIVAHGLQKATEKPQRSKELTVISELDTAALRQLSKSGEASAR
jgi:septal ring factor EnvC (AmiA/AmiB activator)